MDNVVSFHWVPSLWVLSRQPHLVPFAAGKPGGIYILVSVNSGITKETFEASVEELREVFCEIDPTT